MARCKLAAGGLGEMPLDWLPRAGVPAREEVPFVTLSDLRAGALEDASLLGLRWEAAPGLRELGPGVPARDEDAAFVSAGLRTVGAGGGGGTTSSKSESSSLKRLIKTC